VLTRGGILKFRHRMESLRSARRGSSIIAPLLTALAVLACSRADALPCSLHPASSQTPHGSAVRDDTDRDGRPNSVSVRQHAGHIDIVLSGRVLPVTLPVEGRLFNLRLIDVTGDGRCDLLADSAAGPRLWVNTGGTLVAARTHGVQFGWPHLRGGRARGAFGAPGDSADRDPGKSLIPGIAFGVPIECGAQVLVSAGIAARAPCTGSASRAPPSFC
jgi:hypothetical protein